MNNTQKVARIAATLVDGTRVDAVLTVAVVLFNEEDLHAAIRTILPARKKNLAITTATAYGQDGQPLSLPTADDIKIKAEQDYRAKLQADMDEAMEFAKKALEELEGKPSEEETTMNNDNTATEGKASDNESFFDKEFDAAVEDLEKAVEESVKELKGAKAQQYIKNLIKAEDKDVYNTLLESIDGAIYNSRIAASTRTKLNENLKRIKLETNKILANTETSKKAAVLAKLKLMITVLVRKTLALLEGVAMFAFDATSILGVMVARIAHTTVREVGFASMALYGAFKKDIVNHVKHA